MRKQNDGYERELAGKDAKSGKTDLVKIQDRFCLYYFGALVCLGLTTYFFVLAGISHKPFWIDLGLIAVLGLIATAYQGNSHLQRYLAIPKEIRSPKMPVFTS